MSLDNSFILPDGFGIERLQRAAAETEAKAQPYDALYQTIDGVVGNITQQTGMSPSLMLDTPQPIITEFALQGRNTVFFYNGPTDLRPGDRIKVHLWLGQAVDPIGEPVSAWLLSDKKDRGEKVLYLPRELDQRETVKSITIETPNGTKIYR